MSRWWAARVVGAVVTALLVATTAAAQAEVRANQPWPIKVREHVDLWLHSYALLLEDTATVPLFRRGYRDSLIVERNRLGRLSRLDQQRDSLIRGLRTTAPLFGAQFMALHFPTFEPLRQAVQTLVQAGPDLRRAPMDVRLAAAYLPTPPTRAWATAFTDAVADESQSYYHGAWVAAQQARAPVLALADSLWRTLWFPRLRPLIRGSEQRAGELIASLVVEAEGRTIAGDPSRGPTLVVGLPGTRGEVNQMLYAIVHEFSGALAQRAVADNVTPRQVRAGVAARLQGPAVLHASLMVLQRSMPDQVDGFARWYLRVTGKPLPPPSVNASAALAEAFPVPADVISSLKDQLDVMFGGL